MIRTGSDTYMTIWKVTERNGRYESSASTSRKGKDGTTYSNWYVKFYQKAAEKASTLPEKTRIKIPMGSCVITNVRSEATDDKPARNFLNVEVYDFEISDSNPKSTQANDDDDDLPF